MKDQFLEDLSEAVDGGNSIGHQSLVTAVCKEHKKEVLDWYEALELLQNEGFSIGECPVCGWVSECGFMETCCLDDEEE